MLSASARAATLLWPLASCSDDEHHTDVSAVQSDASAPVDSTVAKPPDATSVRDAGQQPSSEAADGGATITACTRNSECDGSPEAARVQDLRCPSEVYCLEGRCHAACSPSCRALREDVNPCSDDAYCDGALMLCRYRPAKCQVASTCPQFRPPLGDGGVGRWSCEQGQCVYPGFSFSTQD